jgi:hypothetical protein
MTMKLPTPPAPGQQAPAGAAFDDDDVLDGPSQRRVTASRLRDLEAIEQNARRVSQQAKEASERATAAEAQALFLVGERTRMACLIGMMAQRLGLHAFVAPLPGGQEGYKTVICAQVPTGLVWWEILDTDAGIPRACGIPAGPTPMGADRLPPEQMYQIVLAPGLDRLGPAGAEPERPSTGLPPVLPGAPVAQEALPEPGVDLGALPTLEEALGPDPTLAPGTAPTCAADGATHVPGPDGSGCACGYFSGQSGTSETQGTPVVVPLTTPQTPYKDAGAGEPGEPPGDTPTTHPATSTSGPAETALQRQGLPATGPQPDGSGSWGFKCASCGAQEVGIKGRNGARARYAEHRTEAHS